MPRFTVTVRPEGKPLMTFYCDNLKEVEWLRTAAHFSQQPAPATNFVDRGDTADEFAEVPA